MSIRSFNSMASIMVSRCPRPSAATPRSAWTAQSHYMTSIYLPAAVANMHHFSFCEWQSPIGMFTLMLPNQCPIRLTQFLQNQQIDVALNSAIASKPLADPSSKLSSEGRHLVADLRDVIEQAKVLVLTKNQGDVFQDFLWQTRFVSAGGAQKPGAPVDKATAQQHGNQALDGLRTLGTLVISNGQFRKLRKACLCPASSFGTDDGYSERCYDPSP